MREGRDHCFRRKVVVDGNDELQLFGLAKVEKVVDSAF